MSALCLSIRQPWAWLIVNGPKDVENRDWSTKFRGHFWIHASAGMTRDEYAAAALFASKQGVAIPAIGSLPRGGIVGSARVRDCVKIDNSPWFFGPNGFLLTQRQPCDFAPCKGALGFFPLPDEVAVQLPELGVIGKTPQVSRRRAKKDNLNDH